MFAHIAVVALIEWSSEWENESRKSLNKEKLADGGGYTCTFNRNESNSLQCMCGLHREGFKLKILKLIEVQLGSNVL